MYIYMYIMYIIYICISYKEAMEDVERHLHECLAPWPFFSSLVLRLDHPYSGVPSKVAAFVFAFSI